MLVLVVLGQNALIKVLEEEKQRLGITTPPSDMHLMFFKERLTLNCFRAKGLPRDQVIFWSVLMALEEEVKVLRDETDYYFNRE